MERSVEFVRSSIRAFVRFVVRSRSFACVRPSWADGARRPFVRSFVRVRSARSSWADGARR
eukprot:9191781-Pyramimonas_sp.AAC.1